MIENSVQSINNMGGLLQNSLMADSTSVPIRSPIKGSPIVGNKAQRKIFMQKKGLVLNHKDIGLGEYSTSNPTSRNPF